MISIKIPNNYYMCTVDNLMSSIIDIKTIIKMHNYVPCVNYKMWIWVNLDDGKNSILCVNKESIFESNKFVFEAVLINCVKKYNFRINTTKNSKDAIIGTFINKHNLVYVKNLFFQQMLPNIELLYSNCVKNMTIGVINIWSHQTRRNQWFKNSLTPKFTEFINRLGKIVSFDNWQGHRGNMSSSYSTVYNHWKGIIPIVYHICPFLTLDECRQFIGNDILLIIFVNKKHKDNSETLVDLSNIIELGAMTQCIAIIEAVREYSDIKYLLRIVVRNSLSDAEKHPYTVLQPIKFEYLEHILLHNFYNFMKKISSREPFRSLYTIPRQSYINELVNILKIDNTNKNIKSPDTSYHSLSNYNIQESKSVYELIISPTVLHKRDYIYQLINSKNVNI